MYLPCSGTADTLLVCEELLGNVFSLLDEYQDCECIIAGDFNTNLDDVNVISTKINEHLNKYSLTRCDNIFPSQKVCTYVNEALKQQSCID